MRLSHGTLNGGSRVTSALTSESTWTTFSDVGRAWYFAPLLVEAMRMPSVPSQGREVEEDVKGVDSANRVHARTMIGSSNKF